MSRLSLQTIWIQPAQGVTPYQVYCGDNGMTLAMLIKWAARCDDDAVSLTFANSPMRCACSGAYQTFRYTASYWTSGWSSGQPIGQDPTQYASYTAGFATGNTPAEALFQTYNNLPGASYAVQPGPALGVEALLCASHVQVPPSVSS